MTSEPNDRAEQFKSEIAEMQTMLGG